MRWRLVFAGLIVGAGLFLSAHQAGALGLPNPFASCPNPAPTPSTPGTGVSGSLDPSPPAGPRAPRSDIWPNYQLPFAFTVYHPGCIAGNVPNPQIEAHIQTWFGNLFLGTAEVLVAAGAAVHGLIANPSWLGIFTKLQHGVTGALYRNVWEVFAPISLLVIAAVIVFEARRASLGPAWRRVMLAVGVLTLVVLSTTAGALVATDVAQGELGMQQAVDSGLGANSGAAQGSAADLEVQSLLYPAWLRGTIGSSTSHTAVTQGPHLLDGSAYTWQETPGGQPSQKTTDAKSAEWNRSASWIKANDPTAYEAMTGKGAARAGAGAEALVGAIVTVPFGLVSDALTAASLLIVVLALMVLPVVGVFGMHQRLEGFVKKILVAVGAGFVNALLFHTAASIQVKATGFLFANLAWWVALFFVALSIPLLWILSRPMRRLIHMPSAQQNPVHELEVALRRVKDKTVGLASTAAMAAVGVPPEAVAAGQANQATRDMRRRTDATVSEPVVVEPASAADPASPVPGAAPAGRSGPQQSPAPAVDNDDNGVEPVRVDDRPAGHHPVDEWQPVVIRGGRDNNHVELDHVDHNGGRPSVDGDGDVSDVSESVG